MTPPQNLALQQDAARAMRPWNLLFFLIYAVQKTANHFEGLSKYPVRKFLKTPEAEGGLGLSPDRAGAFLVDTALGWYIKALFGLLTDNLPLFGYRRKSWLIILSAVAGVAWLWVSQYGTTVHALLAALLIINILVAFSDVVCDGLMVETAQRFEQQYRLPEGTANRPFQAAQWSGAMFAVFLASIGGGVIAQYFALKTAALVSGIAPLGLAVAVAFIVKEEKVPWDWAKARKGFIAIGVIIVVAYLVLWIKGAAAGTPWKPYEPILSAALIIACLLVFVRIPSGLVAPLILVFCWQATPFDSGAQFAYHYFTRHNTEFVAALTQGNFLVDGLRAVMSWFGVTNGSGKSGSALVELYWGSVIGTVNSLFAVFGAVYFRYRLVTVPFARLFTWSILAQGLVILCFLSFSQGGIASPGWLMALMAVEGFVFMIATLSILGYAARRTPTVNQASIFAFFMGMYNLGQVIGREQVGSRLYSVIARGDGTTFTAAGANTAFSMTIAVAVLYLFLVYLLVRYMIRRGYIATHESEASATD